MRRSLLALLAGLLLLGGCTSVTHTFSDTPADQVWTAMLVVAEQPRYADWRVEANEVWVDEAERRIEVYRELRRVLIRPAAKPFPQRQAWRFEIHLDEQEPPEGVFVSRGWGVPAHARIEGERYFEDVRGILEGPGDLARLP